MKNIPYFCKILQFTTFTTTEIVWLDTTDLHEKKNRKVLLKFGDIDIDHRGLNKLYVCLQISLFYICNDVGNRLQKRKEGNIFLSSHFFFDSFKDG